MSANPWFKFYPSDWLAGTRALTPAETGIYITLIAMMYERGSPIPRDDTRLARLCNCPKGAFSKAIAALIDDKKLALVDGGLWNERAEIEVRERDSRSQSASAAAKSRHRIQGQKDELNQCPVPASADPPQCESTATHARSRSQKSESNKRKPSVSKKGARLPADWSPSQSNIDDALNKGLSDNEVRHEAEQFRDFWISKPGAGGCKLDWNATWRNWCGNAVKRRPAAVSRTGQHPMAVAIDELKNRVGDAGGCPDPFSQNPFSEPRQTIELEAARRGHPDRPQLSRPQASDMDGRTVGERLPGKGFRQSGGFHHGSGNDV